MQGRCAQVLLRLQDRCKVQGGIEPHYSIVHPCTAERRAAYAVDAEVALH